MGLSNDLISQFVKATNDNVKTTKKETITYGTAVEYKGSMWVKLDGSELLTPISTTTSVKPDDRVTVMIKNHTAVVTGNMSSPSARSGDIEDATSKISEFEILLAYRVTADELEAINATIDTLRANIAKFDNMSAVDAEIVALKTKFADLQYVNAEEMTVINADIENIRAHVGSFANVSTEDLNAINANIDTLKGYTADFTYVSADVLQAMKAQIESLDVDNLDVNYANIDFANIGKAAIEQFFSKSGLIENVVVGDQTVTGRLVGVTIVGDLIEGNTIKADKLVIKGDDGLYYKLNTDGMTVEAEQTDENSLNGSIIKAKSITATKVAVDDLVAFDATIGGFNITEQSIYSEVKDSDGNTTRGIYMDTDGQFNFGDGTNYVKYYRDESGNYKLAISAESILYALNGKQYSIADLGHLGEYIHIGVYEGEPCIELGETDSDFKLIITNTRILFMEGTDLPAYINNKSLHIKKAVVEEELHQGGFMWKIRSNGNMGLVWKGE